MPLNNNNNKSNNKSSNQNHREQLIKMTIVNCPSSLPKKWSLSLPRLRRLNRHQLNILYTVLIFFNHFAYVRNLLKILDNFNKLPPFTLWINFTGHHNKPNRCNVSRPSLHILCLTERHLLPAHRLWPRLPHRLTGATPLPAHSQTATPSHFPFNRRPNDRPLAALRIPSGGPSCSRPQWHLLLSLGFLRHSLACRDVALNVIDGRDRK